MSKKTKIIVNTIAIIVFLSGLVALLYPIISNQIHQKKQRELQEYYESQVQEIEEKERSSMWDECDKYNMELVDHMVKLTDPFESERLDHAVHPYIDLINPNGDGTMGSVEIPSINCHLMIYHNTDEAVLQKGVGHLQGSSLPVGGIGTHAVLTGHTGSASKELFTNLDQVEVEDVFYLHILGEVLAYQVDQILVVLPEDTSALAIDRDEDLCTLVTCTPYGVNSHRLFVRGHRVPYEVAKTAEEEQGKKGNTWWKQYLLAVLVGIGIVVIILLVSQLVKKVKSKKTSKKKEKTKNVSTNESENESKNNKTKSEEEEK